MEVFSAMSEKDFFGILLHAISGSSAEHRTLRIEGLEELQRRIKSDSVQDKNEAFTILLEMARVQGNCQPESSLTIESFSLLISKEARFYRAILDILIEQPPVLQNSLFPMFSKLVLQLDPDKRREGIDTLVSFLMTRDALTEASVGEVYGCLIQLGNEGLSAEVLKAVSPYLDYSSKICPIIFSVRFCAKFADNKLLPKMLAVLDKSMKGYFDGHYDEIERDICQFLKRIGDAQGLTPLIRLLKMRSAGQFPHINEAMASVLNANPFLVDDVLDVLFDERNENVIDGILQSFAKMDKPKMDVPRLLSATHTNWWWKYPTNLHMQQLLVKCGKPSKPALFEILRQDDVQRYDFALRCLKAIGISQEEIAAIFPKPPMLQIYNYFYKGTNKIPKDLNQIWEEKEKLGDTVPPGKTTRLDHLLLHALTSFNFVALNVDPAGIKGVDIVCFHPETLDLFIVGCTTGIMKDDLAKMDALKRNMKMEMTDLLRKCSITPIVVCSEIAAISPSDAQYAVTNNIAIMQRNDIDTLPEMLNTNRQRREVIEYIKRSSGSGSVVQLL
jgi:hypothetical protein